MKKAESAMYQLCDEIDALKEEAQYWKELYQKERAENNRILNERMADAQQGVATALMFAFSVKDDEHGNLVIDKESRKELAKNFS